MIDHIKYVSQGIWGLLSPQDSSYKDFNTAIISGPFFQHAVASPLTCLNLSLNTAHQYAQANQTKEVVSYLSLAKRATKRLNHLLMLMDAPLGQTNQFLASSTIRETLSLLQLNYPKVIFQMSLLTTETKLLANKFLFQEVITCLLKNAIEAYPTSVTKPIVSVVMKKNRNSLIIVISDGGCGMGWWKKILVTNSGFTSKKTGTGIGLFFAKNYLEKQLHGSLQIDSKQGCGTRVTLLIPLEPVS